jgi:hypothetical protein
VRGAGLEHGTGCSRFATQRSAATQQTQPDPTGKRSEAESGTCSSHHHQTHNSSSRTPPSPTTR